MKRNHRGIGALFALALIFTLGLGHDASAQSQQCPLTCAAIHLKHDNDLTDCWNTRSAALTAAATTLAQAYDDYDAAVDYANNYSDWIFSMCMRGGNEPEFCQSWAQGEYDQLVEAAQDELDAAEWAFVQAVEAADDVYDDCVANADATFNMCMQFCGWGDDGGIE